MVPHMTIELNHTIIAAHDRVLSANFLAEILGLPAPVPFGPFMVVKTDNHVSLDFMSTEKEINPRHYAFLISEAEFDEIFKRICDKNIPYWADHKKEQANTINHNDAGRGLYSATPMAIFWKLLHVPMAVDNNFCN